MSSEGGDGLPRLEEVVLVAREALETVRGGRTPCPVGVTLAKYVEDVNSALPGAPRFAIKITRAPTLPARHVRAIVRRYPEGAAITILGDMSPPWQRLVLAKELMQVLVDQRQEYVGYMRVHLAALLSPLPLLGGGKVPLPSLVSERNALLAALEYLVPVDDRKCLYDASVADLARVFDLPQTIVEAWYAEGWAEKIEGLDIRHAPRVPARPVDDERGC